MYCDEITNINLDGTQTSFTIGTGLAYSVDQTVIISSNEGGGDTPLEGTVTSYNSGTGLSLIHISEPRDRTRSRMPSSA